MDGLILLVILIPLIFLILLLTILNRSNDNKRLLEDLYNQLKNLRGEVADLASKPEEQTTVFKKPVTEKTIIPETIKEEPITIEVLKEEIPLPKPVIPETPLKIPEIEKEPIANKTVTPVAKEKPATDIEKFIGENLVNKIGIAILVLGIAFFIKYAIDKNWINETARVIIGLICGGILIGLAHYFRNTYRSFSSVLVGGGLTVFYFSIAFAFHEYHLMGQTAAFIIMVIISACGVLLSLFYNRQELAILATIGGFITPFLVSTGNENHMALFTYLCILNTGLMVLAWFKRWPAINIIALFFTTFIYAGWLIKRAAFNDPGPLPLNDAFIFATLFYLLFVAMNIINCIRLKNKFNAFDFIILLSTNFLYYVAGMVILAEWNIPDYQGLFTVGLGFFNGILAIFFYRKKTTDQNFVALLMGLALTFISLSAAIRLEVNYVILFWSAEAVILYWLYLRTSIKLLRWASLILVIIMIIALLLNWTTAYFDDETPILINKGFMTAVATSVALFILYYMMRKEEVNAAEKRATSTKTKNRILVAAIAIAFTAGALEIIYQFGRHFLEQSVYVIYLQAYTFATALLLLRVFKRSPGYSSLQIGFITACFGYYLFSLDGVFRLSLELLTEKKALLFGIHWIAAVLLGWMVYGFVRKSFQGKTTRTLEDPPLFTWSLAVGIVLFLSLELYHIMLWLNYNHPADWPWWRNLYYKAGLSMLWGLCSFAMMWLGMKNKFRTLRIISLSLFTVTLIKLFAYDIRNIPPGGKITAFILLGILLLAVSFMYQRLKKIIIDNVE